MSDNTTGQPGGSGQDDASRYPAGQQWQQPSSTDQPTSSAAPAHQSYGQPAAYGQNQGSSPYGSPGQGGGYGEHPAQNPGRTLGIVGFILAILIAPIGLIISIIAFVKSRKAKMGNGFALAGIIIGILFTIIGSIILFSMIAVFGELAQQVTEACQGVPSGTEVTVQGQSIPCP